MTRSNYASGVTSTASFNEISEITKNLFLCAAHVIKPEALKKREINFVVNATVEEPNLYFKQGEYLKIRVADHPLTKLDVYFDIVADKIHNNKQKNNGKTLVHCVAGVSRSATLCLAYLVKYESMTLREAYRHVKNIRSIIRPNWGFWRQLIAYEQKIRGTPTVRMVESKWGPEEPVPDVYVAEVKENFGAEQQPQPQVVRATMYTVPKYFARRSKSEHSMSPEHPPVSSTASTMYSGLTSPNRSRPPNVDLYRNAGDISSNTVTISRSPLSTITTFSYKGPPSKIRDALNDRSGLFINNRSDKLIDSLTIDSLARSTRSPFRIL